MPERPGDTRSTVLVVDDVSANRKLLRTWLSDSYEVVAAADGAEALELYRSHPPDIVILDVVMPRKNGLEVCREIKATAKRYLPVILVTGLSDQEDRIRGLEAGADDFLTKPYDGAELKLRIRAFLQIRRQEALISEQAETLAKQLDDLRRLQSLRDDLFQLIVHDIRNPLSGLVGFVELLQASLSRPEHAALKRFADQARTASIKVNDVLNEVLEVHLLEEGKVALHRERTHVVALVRDAIASLEGAARAGGQTIELAEGGDAVLSLDAGLVRRSLENLLANALKYSPPDAAVTVAIHEREAGVEVSVTDRGPGVPEELKRELFQKFSSVEAKTGKMRRGHGLGLYLVNLAAAAHGGRASVSDAPGGGAVFSLWLPRELS